MVTRLEGRLGWQPVVASSCNWERVELRLARCMNSNQSALHICPNLKTYLFKFQNVFGKITKCICPNINATGSELSRDLNPRCMKSTSMVFPTFAPVFVHNL